MTITAKRVAKLYVAFCVCMNANVFLRIFGGLTPSANGRAGVVNNPVMFGFTAILVLATIILFVRGYKRCSLSLLNNPWLSGLYLWSLCSAIWAPLPSMVLRASLATWSLLLCGVISARYLEAEETANLLCDVVFCLALLSVFYQIVFPLEQTMAPGWTGVYGEKNHMGIGMGLGCIAQFASTRRWTWFRQLQLGLLLTLLVLSQSTTSMIFVFVTGAVFLLIKLPRRIRPLATANVVGTAILAFSFIPNLTELLFGAAGKNTNFTGRDVIWRFTLEQWAKRPLAGYGLYSFWESQDTLIRQWLGWNPGEAHNGFLEIGVTLGVVGEIFLMGALASGLLLIYRARRSGHRTAAVWLTLCWVAIMIDNITEADFLIPGPLWFMYCLVYFTTYMELRRGAVRMRQIVETQRAVPLAGRMPAFAPGRFTAATAQATS